MLPSYIPPLFRKTLSILHNFKKYKILHITISFFFGYVQLLASLDYIYNNNCQQTPVNYKNKTITHYRCVK